MLSMKMRHTIIYLRALLFTNKVLQILSWKEFKDFYMISCLISFETFKMANYKNVFVVIIFCFGKFFVLNHTINSLGFR